MMCRSVAARSLLTCVKLATKVGKRSDGRGHGYEERCRREKGKNKGGLTSHELTVQFEASSLTMLRSSLQFDSLANETALPDAISLTASLSFMKSLTHLRVRRIYTLWVV